MARWPERAKLAVEAKHRRQGGNVWEMRLWRVTAQRVLREGFRSYNSLCPIRLVRGTRPPAKWQTRRPSPRFAPATADPVRTPMIGFPVLSSLRTDLGNTHEKGTRASRAFGRVSTKHERGR